MVYVYGKLDLCEDWFERSVLTQLLEWSQTDFLITLIMRGLVCDTSLLSEIISDKYCQAERLNIVQVKLRDGPRNMGRKNEQSVRKIKKGKIRSQI